MSILIPTILLPLYNLLMSYAMITRNFLLHATQPWSIMDWRYLTRLDARNDTWLLAACLMLHDISNSGSDSFITFLQFYIFMSYDYNEIFLPTALYHLHKDILAVRYLNKLDTTTTKLNARLRRQKDLWSPFKENEICARRQWKPPVKNCLVNCHKKN